MIRRAGIVLYFKIVVLYFLAKNRAVFSILPFSIKQKMCTLTSSGQFLVTTIELSCVLMLAYGCLLLLLRACLLLLLYCFMAVSFVIVLLLSLCREKWMLELTKVWGWTVRESKHSWILLTNKAWLTSDTLSTSYIVCIVHG